MYNITVRSVEYVEAVMLHVSLYETDESGDQRVIATCVRVSDQDFPDGDGNALSEFLQRTLEALVKATATIQTRLDN